MVALVGACGASCIIHTLPDSLANVGGGGCPIWSSAEELAQAAQKFDHGTETTKLECALSALRAYEPGPANKSDTGSRICYLLSDRTVADLLRREELAAEGVRWAEQALALGGGADAGVHYYLALNLGLVAQQHITQAMTKAGRIKDELEKALQLAPAIDDGGPLRVLALIYLKAPPWPTSFGDPDFALERVREAVERFPDHPLNHLYMAQVTWDAEGDAAVVEKHVAIACGLLVKPVWSASAARWRAELKEIAERAQVPAPACAEEASEQRSCAAALNTRST